jgi:hypothetical protein
MQTIVTESDLRNAILFLESKQAMEGEMLKQQFLAAYESVKPINLIKNTFLEAAKSPDMQDNLVNSTIGLSVGYLTKVLFQGFSGGPVKKILGTAIMFGVKNLVAHNPEAIKSGGRVFFNLLRKLTRKRNNNVEPEVHFENDYS